MAVIATADELPVRPDDVFLSAQSLSRSYGPIAALSGVSVDFRRGEVHAIVGENGAGKSTLMRLLAGEERQDAGRVLIEGTPVRMDSPQEARAHGIAIVHQQFQLVDTITVAENIFLGAPPVRSRLGPFALVDYRRMHREAEARLARFGLSGRSTARVKDLTVAERQLVEIARALDGSARLLILDEPTASLGAQERSELFRHVRATKAQGAAVILIAHNLDEVLSIADRVTVLRNGKLIATLARNAIDYDGVVEMIVGREFARGYQKAATTVGEPLMVAEGFVHAPSGESRTIALKQSEIIGIPTYVGAMVDRTLGELTGLTPYGGSSLSIGGRELSRSRIPAFIDAGVCLVPGDAMAEGLIPGFSVADNILLPSLPRFQVAGLIDRRALRRMVGGLIRELDIRPADPDTPIKNLSGGNRQKVVIAKWLARGATIYVMNDPTKSIDVGAKAEIYRLLGDVVTGKNAIVLVSSDTDELIGLSDCIMVLRDREMVAEFPQHPAEKKDVLASIVGSRQHRHPHATDGAS
jgi:ABC-type sugar transport system ATPase subunit